MMRNLFFPLLMLVSMHAFSQTESSLNRLDAQGKRQGQWFMQQPERMGEEAFSEWGSYDHGMRTGTWYRFDGQGDVKSIQHYRLGMLDGEAKYFENGHLACVGHYYGLNPGRDFDTIFVLDPVKDIEYQRVVSTNRGSVKHGYWRFYDEQSGRLTRELYYIVDELVSKKEFAVAPIDSSYYKKREAALPQNQKHFYAPPRDKQFHYTEIK
ncbi:MAG: hypothetical protein JST06_07420 [Bacteroidetes bacterium]|nr:hypothetical protein [Bacteroidota bacterium]MBS1629008.1 hypothetical protein [Bacteroidota bacterium]